MAAAVAWTEEAPEAIPASVPASIPAPDPEARGAALARSGGALRRALCALAGRFVETRAWETLGYARLGDYGRERLGLSASELRDLARVDAALRTLPACEAALIAGTLPWTKLRLIVRTTRPEDEGRWLAFARRVTVRQLAQHTRAVDAGSVEQGGAALAPDEDPERWRGVHYLVPVEVARKWQLGWRVARRVAGENLSVDRAAEAICAEVLSAVPIDPDLETPPPGRGARERGAARRRQRHQQAQALERVFRRVEPDEGATGSPPALPPVVAELIAGLEGADADELDRRLHRAVALEQRREAELGPLLLRVKEGRLYRRRGFPGLEPYAENRLGMSPRKAWALLRIERAAKGCPELAGAYREGHLSWVQAQALLPVLERHPARAGAWIAHAGRVPVRRLRDDVDRAVLLAAQDAEAFARTAGVPDLEAEREDGAPEGSRLQTGGEDSGFGKKIPPREPYSWAPPGYARLFFRAPAEVARLFQATVCTVRRRLGPRATRILDRDGWRCGVPGTRVVRITGGARTRFEMPLGTYESGDVRLDTSSQVRL